MKKEKKEILKEIIKKYNLKAPVDLQKIIDGEKITLAKNKKEMKKEKEKVWGVYISKNNSIIKNKNPLIIYSPKIKYNNSIRFTIAHELSHYFLDKKNDDISLRKKFTKLNEWEKEINDFAINLLIPNKKNFFNLWNKKNINKYYLANYYKVPLQSIEIYKKNNQKEK